MFVANCKKVLTNAFYRSTNVTRNVRYLSSNPIDFPDMGPPIPEYQPRKDECDKTMRARLLYQSRKRGMTENGLVFSHFASRYLQTFDRKQMEDYDNLINKPSNDWDIYYWLMDKVETPKEYVSPIMNMLKEYIKNEEMEIRLRQPDLKFDEEIKGNS